MDELDLGNTIKGFIPGQKVLNRYKLERILGRGGMGVVWLARDEELERDVALKFLPEIVALDPEAVADLKRETRRNLDLTHPHIVRIHDFVSDKRTAAIAMEYVDGSTLAALKLERPGRVFTVGELRPWVEQFLEALHYAHTKAKVVHRDLKPANLMITGAGDLKITDFGIAHSITDSVSRVSKQAGSSGTPVYMSPQQMMGEKTAVTDDLYAVGATLYELLTSKPPFYSGNVIMQVQNKAAPPIAERRAELGIEAEPVPAEWEEAIAACLAKDPAARPQSARELAERLELTTKDAKSTKQRTEHRGQRTGTGEAERVVTVAPSPPDSKTGTQKSKAPVLAGLAAGALLLGGLGWYFGFHVPEQERLAEMAQQKAWERAASGAGEEMGADEKKDIPSAAAKALPQLGQRWVVPELGLEIIPVAAGTFRMGTDSADDDLNLAKPVTQVTISKPFWLGRTEVTQAQWFAVMGRNPAKNKSLILPVESITWEQAMEFCDNLTARERAAGRLPAGYVYRLPTEAQWEYACRAGTTGHHAGDSDAMGWNQNNSRGAPQPVGQKQANAWGLHDMHGNVAEWCLDFKFGKYPGGAVTDFISQGVVRTRRGGNWQDHTLATASWARTYMADGPSDEFTGLRVALVPAVPLPQPEKESPATARDQQIDAGERKTVDGVTWIAPSHWVKKPTSALRKGSYTVRGPEGEADVSITSFPGDTGGLSANLNRWRGQLGLPALSEEALTPLVKRVRLAGGEATLVDFTGVAEGKPVRLLGAILFHGGASWFFKMTGPDALVQREKEAFTTFVESLRFGAGAEVVVKPQPGQSWENSLGQKFVPVPGTDVLFCIWETREQDYAAFVAATGRAWQSANAGSTHPAVKVSWEDAKAFCAWLTEMERREGRLGSDQNYRLPTDAEWSEAVGLKEGSGTPQDKWTSVSDSNVYPWGTGWPPPSGAGNYAPSLNVDSFERTSPVGSLSANRHGLYDLGGNVWEWCEDWFNNKQMDRVLRGASFYESGPGTLGSKHRFISPTSRLSDIGFRVVVAVGSGAPTGGRATDAAPGSRTDTSPGNSPQPSEEFKAWVANLKVGGVRAGQPSRIYVGGTAYASGDVISPALGIVFVGYEAETKLLTFKDASGAILRRAP